MDYYTRMKEFMTLGSLRIREQAHIAKKNRTVKIDNKPGLEPKPGLTRPKPLLRAWLMILISPSAYKPGPNHGPQAKPRPAHHYFPRSFKESAHTEAVHISRLRVSAGALMNPNHNHGDGRSRNR